MTTSSLVSVPSEVERAAAALASASDVTLVAHVHPDADALGSALALGIALHRRGARVRVTFAEPTDTPESLRSLDVIGLVVPPSEVPAAPEVLVACDTADPSRLGPLADRIDTATRTIVLDHHASNRGFGDIRVVDPDAEATVLLVHRVLLALGATIDAPVARCLYAGLVTDTRGFRSASPATYRLAGELVETGFDVEALVRSIFDDHPFAWLAKLGDALRRAVFEPTAAGGLGLVHTTVPLADVERFRSEEVDGVIDIVRTAMEPEVAAVLKQVGPARWSVSLRSKGTYDVSAAAAALGGGGHRSAAGFTCDGSAEEVLAALRAVLR